LADWFGFTWIVFRFTFDWFVFNDVEEDAEDVEEDVKEDVKEDDDWVIGTDSWQPIVDSFGAKVFGVFDVSLLFDFNIEPAIKYLLFD
jgi:4-hydroxybenzoate polyprenyltransferase